MRSTKCAVFLVGLFLLGGCCLPMQLLHHNGHHSGGHGAAETGTDDPNAPQEYLMQEQPPAAPAQPNPQASW